jgi:hypothetical protein
MRSCFGSVVGDSGNHPFLLPSPDERTVEQTGPDWTGLPTRALACLGRRQALAILDGQRGLQEEYLEWQVVRASDDRIRRVELTTELRGYWRVLAASEPEQTLDLISELVNRPAAIHKSSPPFGVLLPPGVRQPASPSR